MPETVRRQADAQAIRDRVEAYLETALIEEDSPTLVRDTERVDSCGEVFTPNWLVKQMMDHMPGDPIADLDKSVLDPACGNGQFLTEGLRRKLVTAAKFFASSLDHERYQFDCLRALSKLYGIDINADTAAEAQERMGAITFKAYGAVVGSEPQGDFSRAAKYFLHTNIVVGDFLAEDFSLVEWIPYNEGSFARKIWPAEVIFSRRGQNNTLFQDILEPSKMLPPVHWKAIAGGES